MLSDRSDGWRVALAGVLVLVVAVLGGCGGDGDDPSDATTSARTTTTAAKPRPTGTTDRGATRCTKAAFLAALLADVQPLPFKVDRVRCKGGFARSRFVAVSCPEGQAGVACSGAKVAAWRRGSQRWRLIAYDDGLSCAAVRSKAADYPAALCD